jgi:hypothetical protein
MNSQHDRSISSSIAKMAGTFGKQGISLVTGEVVSVDKGARTCNVNILTNETEVLFEGVKLQTMVGDGILLIPKVGSNVSLIYAVKQDAIIVQCSDLDGVEFFGGQLGGLAKVIDLVSRLNLIENKVNSIISTYNTHTHASNGTPTTATITGSLTQTARADIENTKIKQ